MMDGGSINFKKLIVSVVVFRDFSSKITSLIVDKHNTKTNGKN